MGVFPSGRLSLYNDRLVISLKKHIEGGALTKTVVGSYRAALTSMATAGAQAMPHLGASLLQKLNLLQQSLSDNVSADELAGVQQGLDRELTEWGESAAQYSRDKAKEIKEIMVAVAATAAAVGERDQRYSSHFSGLTTRLHSIAKLEDLTSIRRSVMESATELKTVVEKMAVEGEQSISLLRAEVANYRTKLEQSEKREAVDPLTGLVNRRGIESQMDERISSKRPFTIAILDLNGFKGINDVHGHLAGDDLLKQFSIELKAQFRATDVVGRWGGDEFLVVVDSDPKEVQKSLDRVRQWVFGDYKISGGKETVQAAVKASIGVAAWDGNESATGLIARADGLMYAEKKSAGSPAR
jgi:diguanylate cyclase (GGDEF)-like protein